MKRLMRLSSPVNTFSNNNISCVPEGHRFGKATPRPFYGVAELLKDANVSPCLFKRDFYKWLGSLNNLKLLLKNKDFQFDDFYKRALYFDEVLVLPALQTAMYIKCF